MKIGKHEFHKGVFLAPMEGVTDSAFRVICRRQQSDMVYSEFIASEALVRDSQKSQKKMIVYEEERPVAVQIFGSRTEAIVESAKMVEDSGADVLDINMGCWVRKVVNHNAGAALLKNPELMVEIAEATVKAVSIPVTVKTRLGWSGNTINIVEIAKMLEGAGIEALTIHCRTREMGLSGEAMWEWIPKIKSAVKLPIILNGDVKTANDALKAFNETGCDAVMIGRAAIGNPFLFRQCRSLIDTGIECAEAGLEERIKTCLEHLKLAIEHKTYPRGLYEFRKHYSGYLKGYRNASHVRQKLVLLMDYEEIKQVLYEFLEETGNSYKL